MQKQKLNYLLGLSFILVLSGCVVRTYPLTKDRIDQDLNMGNRGYVGGQTPAIEEKERKTTRTTQVVEVELSSPLKFERAPKKTPVERMPLEKTRDEEAWGNRGYISQSQTPEIQEPVQQEKTEQYTVQKADTLQKISKKFYGTTKKWNKIYKANQDVLKGPNKIYPGQVIKIPVDSAGLMESRENLK
jgi:nucleoid-associated protein YgaU